MRLMLSPRGAGQKRRAGGAAVELAVLAPFLITIMLGMFELGRGLMVKQTLGSAARKGCRTGILHQYGNSDIIDDATNVMRDNGFDQTRFNPPQVGATKKPGLVGPGPRGDRPGCEDCRRGRQGSPPRTGGNRRRSHGA